MIRRRKRTAYGYVLVEVVVSMVVFSIGVVSVMRTFSVGAHARGIAQDYTVAGFLCQKVMNESRAEPSLKEGTEEGWFGDEFPKFRWVRTVELIKVQPGVPPGEQQEFGGADSSQRSPRRDLQSERQKPITFQRILVTVLWQRKGAEYTVTLETLIPVLDREGF
jgi:type II secretory pathway pseudopilin PulG